MTYYILFYNNYLSCLLGHYIKIIQGQVLFKKNYNTYYIIIYNRFAKRHLELIDLFFFLLLKHPLYITNPSTQTNTCKRFFFPLLFSHLSFCASLGRAPLPFPYIFDSHTTFTRSFVEFSFFPIHFSLSFFYDIAFYCIYLCNSVFNFAYFCSARG